MADRLYQLPYTCPLCSAQTKGRIGFCLVRIVSESDTAAFRFVVLIILPTESIAFQSHFDCYRSKGERESNATWHIFYT